jgi:AcrR family transcriptional regulator
VSTKEDIIEAALRLYEQQGYMPTTVRDITASLDITPAALYYHFKSKEAVLLAVAEPLIRDSAYLIKSVEGLELTPETARTALETYYDVVAKNPNLARALIDDPGIHHHPEITKLWAHDAVRFYHFLSGGSGANIDAKLRTTAALAAVRRGIEIPDIDLVKDKDLVVTIAMGNLRIDGEGMGDKEHQVQNWARDLAAIRSTRDQLNTFLEASERNLNVYKGFVESP